ncbi:MAG: phosphatase PAP2 family protein [Candidatus Hodarchaeales archaeon]|jgi:membrane-associated phospholipid phosphatase
MICYIAGLKNEHKYLVVVWKMFQNRLFDWESKKSEFYFKIIIILWIILAIVFLIFDLQISKIFIDYNSKWAKFVTDYGEIPGRVTVVVSLCIQIYRINSSSNWKFNIWFWAMVLINTLFLSSILSSFYPSQNSLIINSFILLISALSPFLLIMLLKSRTVVLNQTLDRFSRVTLILGIINSFLLVQSLKLAWGRVRFRDLNPDHSNFTPWIFPRGFNGNRSFPSGHTAMGWMVLPLLLLIPNDKPKYRKIAEFCIVSWGLFVAFGRIVIGAHYASDVLFSTGFAITIYLLLKNMGFKNHRNSCNDI